VNICIRSIQIMSLILISAFTINAEDSMYIKSTKGKFILPASKGDVVFDHEMHKKRMESEGCIPCHKSNNNFPESIHTRFDERIAHYFCKGCHREKGVGPIECHQCHTIKH